MAAAYALILPSLFREMAFSVEVWRSIAKSAVSVPMLFWIANSFWTALFAWSTRFIDVSVAAALIETWPLAMALLTARLFRSSKRYSKITPTALLMFGASIAGASFVAASQTGGFGGFSLSENPGLPAGTSLALGAVFLLSLRAYGFKWASDCAERLSLFRAESRRTLEIFAVAAGIAVSGLATLPIVASLSVAMNEPFSRDAALFAFSRVGEVSAAHLLAGLTLIVAANAGGALQSRAKSA